MPTDTLHIIDLTPACADDVRALVARLCPVDRLVRVHGLGPTPQSVPVFGDADDAARIFLRWLDDFLLRGTEVAEQLGQRKTFQGATFRATLHADARLIRVTGAMVFPEGEPLRAEGIGCLLQRVDAGEFQITHAGDAGWEWYAAHAGGEPATLAQRAAFTRAQQQKASGPRKKQWDRRGGRS